MEEPINQISSTQNSPNPSVNKPVENPLPVQNPPPTVSTPPTTPKSTSPSVQKKPRKFKMLLIAILLIVISGFSGFLYSEIKNADRRPVIYKVGDIENKKEESVVETKVVIFAKQTSSVTTKDNKELPIYSVYKMAIDGSQKELLLTAGDKDNFPLDFKLLPSKTGLIVTYKNHLDLYDFSKKLSREIFKSEGSGSILGYVLSKDEGKITVSVNSKVYIKEVDGNDQKIIFENKDNVVSILPSFWSPDGTKIYLKETSASDKVGNYWQVSVEGTDLNKLPVNVFGEFSPDGKAYAYFDYDGTNPKWLCFGFQPNVLKVYTLAGTFSANRETVAEGGANKRYSFIRWSADGSKFMYVSELYKSGEGCRSEFYPEETYVYDTRYGGITKSSKNKTDLLKEWFPGGPDVQIKPGEKDKNGDSMIINGFLADQQNTYPLKIVYIGYLN